MPHLEHLIDIARPADQVRALLDSGAGLSRWWAEDVAPAADGAVHLGFFSRATVYVLRADFGAQGAIVWHCDSGREWTGTTLRFVLTPQSAGTRVQFRHERWHEQTAYFHQCNTTWGALLFRLKAVAEGAEVGPLFSRGGLSLHGGDPGQASRTLKAANWTAGPSEEQHA